MPHAVTSTSDGKTYTYDCNGNMLSDWERTFTWDADNRPVSITQTGVGTTTFAYSGTGARVKKASPGGTIRYAGAYEDHVTDGVKVKHLFAGSLRVATRVTGGPNAGIYYIHGDHLGSLNVFTNSSGTEVQRLTYLPYGEAHTNSGSVDFHQYRYTDQEQDPETGLYFYQARYYNPVLGRFISPDSLVPEPGNPQSLNRYSYVANNPLNLIDPTGHFWEWEDFTGLVSSVWNQLFSYPTSAAMVPVYPSGQTGALVMESGTILDTTILPGTGPGTAWDSAGLENLLAPKESGSPTLSDVGGILWKNFKNATIGLPERIGQDIADLFYWPATHPVETALLVLGSPNLGALSLEARTAATLEASVLPPNIAATFERGVYRAVTLQSDVTVARVFGGDAPGVGSFLTRASAAPTQAEAIANLRLPPGNLATNIAEITIPKGTQVFVGRVAGGNAPQYFVPDPTVLRLGPVRPLP